MVKLREYESHRRDMDIYMQDQRVDRRDIIDEFEAKLIEKGLMKESGELATELEEAITARREIADTYLVKLPVLVFSWDIFRFLLIKPYRERRYASGEKVREYSSRPTTRSGKRAARKDSSHPLQ
jgi:ribosomal protein S13